MGSQRIGHDLGPEQQQLLILYIATINVIVILYLLCPTVIRKFLKKKRVKIDEKTYFLNTKIICHCCRQCLGSLKFYIEI